MVGSEVDHRLQLLRAHYAGSLAAKHDALTSAWEAYLDAPMDATSRRELALQIHRLCGSAASYGYVELGDHACKADRLLGRPVFPSPDELRAAAHALIDALERAAAAAQAMPPQLDVGALRVVLVAGDPARADLIARQLEARGCQVRIESGRHDLWQALARWPCHAVVFDGRPQDGSAVEIIRMLRREPAFARIALLCRDAGHDAQAQRMALEADCDAVLARHDDIDRLFEAICACVAREDRSARVFPRGA